MTEVSTVDEHGPAGRGVLAAADWLPRRDAHLQRVRRWTAPHVRRRGDGASHPVLDFLFTYYSQSPAALERWHPGLGVTLAGEQAAGYLRHAGYLRTQDGITLDPARFTAKRRSTTEFVRALLAATASRPARLGCFGLHEWAMVYRDPAAVRHAGWPLRLGAAGTDEVVAGATLKCSHFDAFRFFTDEAAPRNTLTPTRQRQVELEQPGCLQATMDLYKWAYKLSPFLCSDLTADCFELAVDARTLDMRASPYDLRALGYAPVPIETERGRADYVREQAALAERAAPLRASLLTECDVLLAR